MTAMAKILKQLAKGDKDRCIEEVKQGKHVDRFLLGRRPLPCRAVPAAPEQLGRLRREYLC